MKAIVKETGDEICLSRTNNKDKDGYKVWWGEDGRTYFTHELNFLNLNDISCKNCEIDWEQRRYEFVKEILIASTLKSWTARQLPSMTFVDTE